MSIIPDSPYRVPFDGSFELAAAPTAPPEDAAKKKELVRDLDEQVDRLRDLQRILYAHDHHAVLLVFQAMDAAGKDGTIRAVMSGVNPAGCQVFSFKQPSAEELEHDFLWRCARRMPERGRIGVFNRSYYEEVLVVRVHPEYLDAQRLPDRPPAGELWQQRFHSIREFESHAASNGTLILKFWLNVSKDEQRERFLARIDEPEKNWKFSEGDVRERQHWNRYMEAYEEALRETSRPRAPWYAIPADDKRFMRATVAKIIADGLEGLGLHYPDIDDAELSRFQQLREQLSDEEEPR
jgi:PPK2 family polyphosphate:nucleotide phosphotransferase